MSYLIDRQAVIDLLKQMRKDGGMVPWEGKDVFARIRKLPTIQPEKAQLFSEGTTSDLISRTETVEHLRRVLDATVPITDYDEGYVDGVDFGISTVSTMPTIQPVATDTNVGDTISRQAAIDALDFEIVHMTAYCDGKNEGNPLAQYNKGLEDGKKAIEALPSAQPEPQWIPCEDCERRCKRWGNLKTLQE